MVCPVNANIYTLKSGEETGSSIELNDDVFAIAYDNKFMSMYFARMKSASYVPTNKTKNVSEVSGTGKKPFKQKHTGNARQGSMRSAQMRGGGIALGPRGVCGFVKIPKCEAVLAKSMLLSKALAEGKLFVIEVADFNSCKTKNAKKVLSKFGGNNFVILNDGNVNPNSLLAVRNIAGVKFVSNNMLTARDLIYADTILIDVESVKKMSRMLDIDC